ncbi:MAG: hypothetical protein FJW23_02035 [Acidimicrobiia bacterium]|nr:hypothetical protein [Acidimicrobiia bacterium]
MPFLRVLRDKRGYETTYLMDYGREGARQRSRVLYVFRSPPGLRVGRQVLEGDVRREIETAHPEIAFDWRAVFADRQVIETRDVRRPRRRREADSDEPAAAPAPAPDAADSPAPASAGAQGSGVPAAIEGATDDERLAWLRGWYPRLHARVTALHDPARREALTALAERLNPDGWAQEVDLATHLHEAGVALERLSRVLTRRRQRRRAAGPGAPGAR